MIKVKEDVYEELFVGLSKFMVLLVIVIFLLFFMILLKGSISAFLSQGYYIIIGIIWDPVKRIFGGLPFIYGTVYTSILALIMAVPISIGVAISTSELLPTSLTRLLDPLIEMMAAIPSIIYGMWALFILGPFLRDYVEPFLSTYLSFIPIFQGPMTGLGYINASIILFIMILPIISSLARESIRMVPREIEELTLAIGGTRWEAIKMKLHVARLGIIGGVILGLSRAVGETMAVLLVIGNKPSITLGLFNSGSTTASVIANEYPEAIVDVVYASSLIALALILFLISLVINLLFVKYIRRRMVI
jgi:phosphate transport system permease protein